MLLFYQLPEFLSWNSPHRGKVGFVDQSYGLFYPEYLCEKRLHDIQLIVIQYADKDINVFSADTLFPASLILFSARSGFSLHCCTLSQ
jgi:hypothetical protein